MPPSSDSQTPEGYRGSRLCMAWELVLKHLGKHGAVSAPAACVFYCTVALWTLVVFACTHNSTLSRVLDELEHLRGDPVSFPQVLQLHSLHVLSKHRLRSELFKHMPFSPGSTVCFWETGQACYHFFSPHDWTQGYTWGSLISNYFSYHLAHGLFGKYCFTPVFTSWIH